MGVLFEIYPKAGIEINRSIRILLGSKIGAVEEVLEEHKNMQSGNSYYYYESNLHIETAEDGKVSEIEISADSSVEVRLFNVNPFACEDKELVEMLSDKLEEEADMQGTIGEATDVSWERNGITLWRPTSPQAALESAEEAKADGFYEAWLKEEYEPSKLFKTILMKKVESEA